MLLSSFLCITVKAQDSNTLKDTNEKTQTLLNQGFGSVNVPMITNYVDIEGSPYLNGNSDWNIGELIVADGKIPQVYIRYNCYERRLEYLKDEKAFIADPKTIKAFIIKNDKDMDAIFVQGVECEKSKISSTDYVRRMYKGKICFFIWHKTNLVEDGDAVGYKTGHKVKKFITEDEWFILDEKGKYHKVRPNKKSAIEALPNYKIAIEDYTKSQKLSLKKPSEWVQLLYNLDGATK